MNNFASIFSSNILTEGYTGEINSIDAYRDSSLSESYFAETLKFVQESNTEFNNANKAFYRAVLESDNDYIAITEAFDGFFDAVKKIINKVIDFIKTLWGKFVTALNKFFNAEKYLKDHLKDLDKFTGDDEFTYDGFEFSINDGCPAKNVIPNLMGFGTTADGDLVNASLTTPKAMQDTYDKLITTLEDDWYDRARAKILGRDNDKVYDDEYAEELFKVFRSDELHKQELTITPSSITTHKVIFQNHKDLEKAAKRTKNDLDHEYEQIKKGFDKAIKRIGDNYSFIYKVDTGDNALIDSTSNNTAKTALANNDIRKTLELYTKAKSDQVQKLSNLHLLAFSAKLDAIKDQTRQAKQILYKALYKIQGKVRTNEV